MFPSYFKDSTTDIASAARLVNNSQALMLNHYKDQVDFLNKATSIEGLSTERTFLYYPVTLVYPDLVIWNKLTSQQKDNLKARYAVIDPITNEIEFTGVVNLESIESTFNEKGLRFLVNFDYEIDTNIIRFMTDFSTEVWDRTITSISILGKVYPLQLMTMPVFFKNLTVTENWYYKRLGIILGMSETASNGYVMARYRLLIEGLSEDNVNALIGASLGMSATIKTEVVKSIGTSSVTCVSGNAYSIPVIGAESILAVAVGNNLAPGSSFVKFLYNVNDNKFPGWLKDESIFNTLVDLGGVDFRDELKKAINGTIAHDKLQWGLELPVRLSVSGESDESLGLWATAPVASVPALVYKLGEDLEVIYPEDFTPATEGYVIYSTIDRPLSGTVECTITYSVDTKEVTVSTSDEDYIASVDDSGVFTLGSGYLKGLSGRIFNRENNLSEKLFSVKHVDVTGYVDYGISEFPINIEVTVSSNYFNNDMEPAVRDWVFFSEEAPTAIDAYWRKAKVLTVTTSGTDYVLTLAWDGRDAGTTGTYHMVMIRSFDGEPHTGVDHVRINAMEELLSIVSRHIEVIVVDSNIKTVEQVKQAISVEREWLNAWKYYIVVGTNKFKTVVNTFENIRQS